MMYVKQFLVTLIVFLGIDMIWLGVIASKMYRTYLGHLMADQFIMGAAFAFYIIYVLGLLHFVIRPALMKGDLKFAICTGALFGFIAYATYDLTNLATLKAWPLMITVIDLAWGAVLSGLVSAISYLILKAKG